MSIASQISRLQNIKTAIRNALVNKGISSAASHNFEDFATDISDIPAGGTYQSKTVSPTTSSQTVTPDSGYDALSQVTVNAMNLQSKSQTVTPSANWSESTTSSVSITPDSGYDGLSSVSVSAPMCRDYMLFQTSQVDTPATVYNGDTAQSNSAKHLRIKPTKDGMVYTASYLELPASSAMGNATAADVVAGKTFSSAAGIEVTGTGSSGTDTSDATLNSSSQMLSGVTAYSNGVKYTGSITTINESSYYTSSRAQVRSGYYPNSFYVTPSVYNPNFHNFGTLQNIKNGTLNKETQGTRITKLELLFNSASGYEGFTYSIAGLTLSRYYLVAIQLTTSDSVNSSYGFGFSVDTTADAESAHSTANSVEFSRTAQTKQVYACAFMATQSTHYLNFSLGAINKSNFSMTVILCITDATNTELNICIQDDII